MDDNLSFKPNEFHSEKEFKESPVKEKIAAMLAQRENAEPGSVNKLINDRGGALKFDSGHHVTFDHPDKKSGMLKIWEPGEYEKAKSDYEPSVAEKMPLKDIVAGKIHGLVNKFKNLTKKALIDIIVEEILKSEVKKSMLELGKTSTGKQVFQGLKSAETFDNKYSNFSPEEHGDAANLHLASSEQKHDAGDIKARDAHMTDALEHMARGNRNSETKRKYYSLFDKFYS